MGTRLSDHYRTALERIANRDLTGNSSSFLRMVARSALAKGPLIIEEDDPTGLLGLLEGEGAVDAIWYGLGLDLVEHDRWRGDHAVVEGSKARADLQVVARKALDRLLTYLRDTLSSEERDDDDG